MHQQEQAAESRSGLIDSASVVRREAHSLIKHSYSNRTTGKAVISYKDTQQLVHGVTIQQCCLVMMLCNFIHHKKNIFNL